jgi:hypothetical protein
MGRSSWLLLAAIAAMLAMLAAKDRLVTLPAPSASTSGFDANRAIARLRGVLGDQRPHPADSANGDAVRDRLIAAMRGVGLEPRLTDDFACNGFAHARAVACARVRNLVARIGPREGPALMLAAHYDSTFAGPGAGDDGIGVATMLEVAARLRGRRLSRPVIFLIDEGEEMGLIGARAFLDRDPAAAHVDTLLNMEARGVTGPAIMFETSRPNAPAVALYRAAAARPVANSLSTDLYGLIPNSTDVSVFKARPWTILNFAIIGNETRYHSAGDDLAALDPASVQHMGDQVLAVTDRVLAGGVPAATGTRLYADILGRTLIVLPLGFGLALLGVLLAFFALTSWRRRALGRPLAAVAAGLVGALLLAWLGQFALGFVREGVYWRAWPGVTLTAIYAATIAAILVSLRTIGRRADRRELRAAFWLVFTLVGAAIAAIAPGGAIYFLLPPLIAALGLAFGRGRPPIEVGAALLAAVALFLTFGPALGLFEELLSAGPFWVFAPLGGLILLPWLIELEPLIARPRRIAPIAAALCLAGWIAAAATPAYSADKQQRFGIAYLWDAQANRGRWMIEGDGARRPEGFAWGREPLPWAPKAKRWMADAPAWPGPAPAAVPIGESRADGRRRIRLRLAAHGADQVTLFAPPGTALAAAGAPGFVQPFGEGGADAPFVLRCTGRACDGAELDLVARGMAPLPLTVVGTFYSPRFPGAVAPPPRPPLARPQYAPDSRIALTRLRL